MQVPKKADSKYGIYWRIR